MTDLVRVELKHLSLNDPRRIEAEIAYHYFLKERTSTAAIIAIQQFANRKIQIPVELYPWISEACHTWLAANKRKSSKEYRDQMRNLVIWTVAYHSRLKGITLVEAAKLVSGIENPPFRQFSVETLLDYLQRAQYSKIRDEGYRDADAALSE